jgi:hypothetical protein
MAQCAEITRGGAACKAIPITGEDYCYAHHPDTVEERKRNGHRGGVRGGRGRPRVEMIAIKQQLQSLADGVLDGSVQRADAAVAGQLLNYLIAAIKVELQIKDQVEHDERITALEEKLAPRQGPRSRPLR